MRGIPWSKFILVLLLLAILIGSSGCQAAQGATKGVGGLWDELTSVPHRAEQALIDLFSSIGSVGSALAESFGNMIGGILGK